MNKIWKILGEKWPEYLLEITVIVFSILTALALDNWNQSRIDNTVESKYLNRFLLDFREDKITLDKEISDIEHQIKVIDSALYVLTNYEKVPAKGIKRWLLEAMGANMTTYARSTFNDLLSTGQAKTIKDDVFVELLYDYYNSVDEIQYKNDESSITYSRDTFNPYIMGLFPVFVEEEMISSIELDVETLSKDVKLISILGFKRILIRNQREGYQELLEKVNTLIEKIENN